MLPPQLWELTLYEFNQCVREYNLMQKEQLRADTAQAWKTANFTGAAFAGKLKKLNVYLTPEKTEAAPKITKEEFERKLAAAQKGGGRSAIA